MNEATIAVLKTWGELCFTLVYVGAIFYTALAVCLVLGGWTWGVVVLELAPFVAFCIQVADEREENRRDCQAHPSSNVDREQSLKDYVESMAKIKLSGSGERSGSTE